MTYTFTQTSTFTRTSARYLASKVATDLYRLNRLYGRPSEPHIDNYNDELVELLLGNYVQSVEYGFKRQEYRILTLSYEVQTDGSLSDSDAGGIYARASDVRSASWFSYMTYSAAWYLLSHYQRASIQEQLPFQRSDSLAPRDGNGYWTADRGYSTDGTILSRQTFRPY